MVRPNLIDLNPVELKYYPFMISLDKFSGSSKRNKNINIKVFNLIKIQHM